MKSITKTLLPLAGIALAGSAHAAVIITPISGTVNVQLDGAYGIENTIDGSGLSGGGTSGDILSETHSRDSTGSGNAWLENSATPTVMTFDLGGTFTVESVHLWNYVHSNGSQWGVATVDISFSTDGGSNYGNLIDDLGVFTQPGDPIAAQTIGFSAVSGVTHIKLDGITGHSSLTGISEIRFGEAIPEPSSLALLGLGGLALLRRRRG